MEENSSTESEYNLDKICRSCLTEDGEMQSMFINEGMEGQQNINDMIMAFAQVQVLENDGLPGRICVGCINNVHHAYSFKQQCERSDATLRDYIMRKYPTVKLTTAIKQEMYSNDDFHLPIKPEITIVESDPLTENFYDGSMGGNDEMFNNTDSNDSDKPLKALKKNRSLRSKMGNVKLEKVKLSPFECDYCDKILVDAKGLTLHTRLHTGENLKRCGMCDKGFAKTSHLTRHMAIHDSNPIVPPPQSQGPHQCQFCDKSFDNNSQLSAHIATHELAPRKRGRPSKKELLLRKHKQKEQEKIDASTTDIIVKVEIEDDDIPNEGETGKSYHCGTCDKHFTTPEGLDIHTRKHTGEKLAVCKICDKFYTRTNHLKRHINTHNTHRSLANIDLKSKPSLFDPPFEESDTQETLIERIIKNITEGQINQYVQISSKSGQQLSITDSETSTEDEEPEPRKPRKERKVKIHTCSICNAGFTRTNHIIRHMAVHNNEYPFKCTVCEKIFPNEDILNKHLKSQCNNTSKPYKCKICNMKFMWQPSLLKHELKHHGVEKEPNKTSNEQRDKAFICGVCNKAFFRQEHLDRHTKIHLPAEKKFECPTCEKKFNRKDNLRSHLRVHKVEKDDCDKHLCVYCGRSFSNSSNLIVHMRRHTGEKPYKCDICEKGFPRSSDLQCHRRTHTGEKPCLCTICGKGFSRSNKLVRHMRIHTGHRPYKCTFCERAFTQSNDLTLHIRRHTGDKPYVCGICGDRFIQGTALQAHRRMQGHFEELNQPTPFASISVNNPNRHNNPNRVNRIGTAPSSPPPSITGLVPSKAVESTASTTAGLNLSTGVVVNTVSHGNRVVPAFTGGYVPNGVPFLSNTGVLMQNLDVTNAITNIPLFSISQYNQAGYN